jgi:hypothetical protein
VRREDVGDASAAEGGGADRLDGERREEEPLARAQDDRVSIVSTMFRHPVTQAS